MAKAMGWCVPCHDRGVTVQAVMVIDGDGHCQHCGTLPAAVPVPLSEKAPELEISLCARGCGKRPHRGACAGAPQTVGYSRKSAVALPPVSEFGAVAAKIDSFLAKPVELPPVTAPVAERKDEKAAAALPDPSRKREPMDKLVSKRVRIADIPAEVVAQRKPIGRIGELWLKVLALPPGEAECVENMDVPHAGYTMRHMRMKGRAARREVQARRVGTQVYFWLAPQQGGA